MTKLHPVVRMLLIAALSVVTMIAVASVFLIVGDESSDASADLTTTTVGVSTDPGSENVTATSLADRGSSVDDVAERFRQTVNGRDVGSVSKFAPTASADTLDFLIGGGPYQKVDCYVFEGKDECRVVNGIADFAFAVDASSGSVSEVTYVGGE